MARRLARTAGRLPARAGDRSLRCRPVSRLAAGGTRGKELAPGARRARLATATGRARLATATGRARLPTATGRARLAARRWNHGLAAGPEPGLAATRARTTTSPQAAGLAASPGRERLTAPSTRRERRVAVSPRRPWTAAARTRQNGLAAGTGRVRSPWQRPAAANARQPEPAASDPAVHAGGRSRSMPGRLPAPLAFQVPGCILAARAADIHK
jgi:hypothetical protein